MSYKVKYYTLAIMPDGTPGNIKQGGGQFFTDAAINDIPQMLNKYLEQKKLIGVIESINNVQGFCLNQTATPKE